MKILVTTMHKGPIQNKKIKCINILETIKIAELLRKKGHNVTLATLKDTDVAISYSKLDVNSFDKVLIINSKIDFPGGEENLYIEGLFEFLKPYKKTLYYVLVDLAIPFEQLYNKVEKREWCKYKSAEEINLENDFVIISQSKNLEEARRIHQNSDINIKDIRYVPINEWVLHTNTYVENSGEVDLILGTSNRGGKRRKKYTDYFFGRENITTEFYGLIKKTDFLKSEVRDLKEPIFSSKLDDCTKIVEKNSTGFATVIVGDPNYNNNMITLRLGESLLANCVTFIDEDFDKAHTIFPNCRFMYVNSGKELELKILKLKENPDLYDKVINLQHELVEEIRKNNLPKKLSESILEEGEHIC